MNHGQISGGGFLRPRCRRRRSCGGVSERLADAKNTIVPATITPTISTAPIIIAAIMRALSCLSSRIQVPSELKAGYSRCPRQMSAKSRLTSSSCNPRAARCASLNLERQSCWSFFAICTELRVWRTSARCESIVTSSGNSAFNYLS